jgi:hypothetical protein
MGRRWLEAALLAVSLLGASATEAAEDHRGYGPWRLGMSPDAVRAVTQYGPYRNAAGPGGLETANGVFEGQQTTISFVFGSRGLSKIQISAYEGPSADAAIEAWYRVYHYLARVHGSVESGDLDVPADVSREDFIVAARRVLDDKPAGGLVRLQIVPVPRPPGVSVFSSLFRQPGDGYAVFLYYQEF